MPSYLLDRAHFADSGTCRRVEDRRLANLLCRRCHNCHVSDPSRLPAKKIDGSMWPTIGPATMLAIKEEMDPGYWDPVFIAECWHSETLPEPEPRPRFWQTLFDDNVGRWRNWL